MLITMQSFGQNKLQWVAKLGFNSAFAMSKSPDISPNRLSSKNALQIGIGAKKNIKNNFLLEADLLFDGKGNGHKNSKPGFGKYVTTSLCYLQTNLGMGYKLNVDKNNALIFSTGLYAAMGVYGREKGFFYGDFPPYSTKINERVYFTTSEDKRNYTRVKPFDFGLNLGTAYNYKKYILYLNYSSSFTNREIWSEIYNRVFTVGIGYTLKI